MTPRLHGIHHSDRPEERGTNFGTLLTLWDRLHRTYLEGVPHGAIRIGLPRTPDEPSAYRVLAMPFTRREAPRS